MIQSLCRAAVTTLILLLSLPGLTTAADSVDNDEKKIIDVMGKISDHDYLEVLGAKIYLPRILFVDSFFPHVYGTTAKAIESGDFVKQNGGLVRSDGAPVRLDMSVTSHLMYVWFGIILSFLITFWAASKYKKGIGLRTEPKGAGLNIFEIIFIFVRDDIAKEYIPGDKYKKYVPYLFAVFMSISFMNLFGLLPWGVSATADLTVTATLAAITFLITQFSGTKDHWRHVFVFPGVHPLVRFILTPVEILGLFTKPFALAIRLFANMLSGKIMIISILGLIFIFTDLFGATIGLGSSVFWVGLTALLYILKAFIALLQAYIFTLLSGVFIGMAAEEHDHAHDTAVAHEKAVNI
ncbi:MAG: F0F1 ATP synthase subunit A [Balneolaceae bacterium]